MSYPEFSPVEYLILLRRHRWLKSAFLSSLIKEFRESGLQTAEIAKELAEVNEQFQSRIDRIEVHPRQFDVFNSEAELAIKTFEESHPKPISTSDCRHGTTQIRKRTFRGGSTHIVTQCLECGSSLDSHKKEKFCNIGDIPPFDDDLYRNTYQSKAEWEEERRRAYNKALYKGFEHFDEQSAISEYLKDHPEPISPEDCHHPKSTVTRRTYSNGNTAFVQQCLDCGKHIRAISKATIKNHGEVPAFDESKQELAYKNHNRWFKTKMDILRSAHNEHQANLKAAVSSGLVQIQSTFHSYYDSAEWSNTRRRIFQRDENKCQACHQDAQCVHHLLYDRLGRENDLDLISLCHRCHDEVHDRQNRLHGLLKLTPSEIKALWSQDSSDLSHYLIESDHIMTT
tara:strand:+ start:29 stop:1222 length:1194 start_codon:yes stop_codon:yes gene_type:complete